MYDYRQEAVVSLLQLNNCTGCLITDVVDVEYICGFRSSNAAVIISSSERVLFSDFRYQAAADLFLKKNRKWKFVLVKGNLMDAVGQYISPGACIGFQSENLTVDLFNRLKRSNRKVSFKPLSSHFSGLFIQKARFEINAMKKAAQIADYCFAQFLDVLHPDMSEREAAQKLDILCLDAGSEGAAFDTIVLSGLRAALPHGQPGKNKLSRGKFIVIDFGCTIRGFCSDMTRTVVIGDVSKRMNHMYTTVLCAQREACMRARAGMYTDELDTVARSLIEANGFGSYFGHALGHGVGLRIHEQPRVSSQCHTLLVENSVITIEPGIYIPGFGGVRIEDMVRVTRTGIDILSLTPKELISL